MSDVEAAPQEGEEETVDVWGEDIYTLLKNMDFDFLTVKDINNNKIAVASKRIIHHTTMFIYYLKSSFANSSVISISVDNNESEVFWASFINPDVKKLKRTIKKIEKQVIEEEETVEDYLYKLTQKHKNVIDMDKYYSIPISCVLTWLQQQNIQYKGLPCPEESNIKEYKNLLYYGKDATVLWASGQGWCYSGEVYIVYLPVKQLKKLLSTYENKYYNEQVDC